MTRTGIDRQWRKKKIERGSVKGNNKKRNVTDRNGHWQAKKREMTE
jgi:hypothetical protein